jgi:GxxExxY protein
MKFITNLDTVFLESVYRNSLQLALIAKDLLVETEVAVPVFFRGKNVGDFRADMVINGCLLLELKRVLLNFFRSIASASISGKVFL